MNNATKTISHILRDNICSFFNLLNFLILCSLVAVGAWNNTPFFLVIVLNTAIGITQEIKAKRQVERLSLLTQPAVTMLVGGKEKTARAEDVQKGDLLLFAASSVVCTDCLVKEGRLEVSEAILTGESEAVIKLPGDELLSGSSGYLRSVGDRAFFFGKKVFFRYSCRWQKIHHRRSGKAVQRYLS